MGRGADVILEADPNSLFDRSRLPGIRGFGLRIRSRNTWTASLGHDKVWLLVSMHGFLPLVKCDLERVNEKSDLLSSALRPAGIWNARGGVNPALASAGCTVGVQGKGVGQWLRLEACPATLESEVPA